MEINANIFQGKRLRLALESRSSICKIWVTIITRRDILYDDLADELAFLKTVKPFPEKLRYQLLRNPSNKLDNLFSEFSLTPIASASAHKSICKLKKNNKLVAVKVLRPNVLQNINGLKVTLSRCQTY